MTAVASTKPAKRTAKDKAAPAEPTYFHAPETREEAAFMQGKLMAAITVCRLGDLPCGGEAALPANYRHDSEYVPQTNPIMDDLRIIMAHPELADGYTGGLMDALTELVNPKEAPSMAEAVAKVTYAAARTNAPFTYGGPVEDYPAYMAPDIATQQALVQAGYFGSRWKPLAREEFIGWRAKTAALLDAVREGVQEALDADVVGDRYPEANCIFRVVLREVNTLDDALEDAAATRDAFYDASFTLMALLRGAAALEESPKGLRGLLAAVINQIDAASTDGPGLFLDGPGGDAPGHSRVESDSTVVEPLTDGPERAAPMPPTAPLTPASFMPDAGEVAKQMLVQATYEIDALAQRVRDTPNVNADDDGDGYLIRLAAIRIIDLNGWLMSFLGGSNDTLHDVALTVFPVDPLQSLADLICDHGGAQ